MRLINNRNCLAINIFNCAVLLAALILSGCDQNYEKVEIDVSESIQKAIREADGKRMMARLLKEYSGGKFDMKDQYVTVGPDTDLAKLPNKHKWLKKEKLMSMNLLFLHHRLDYFSVLNFLMPLIL